MRSGYWTRRCLARDPDTGRWCTEHPTDGVFCGRHGLEFRHEEAAKTATRLAQARLTLREPSTTGWARWQARGRVRRASSLRRALLGSIAAIEDARSLVAGQTDFVSAEGDGC